MLRTLLSQRFKLALHRDQRAMQVHALEVVKGGPKLQDAANGDRGESGCSRSFAETPGATLAAVCKGMTSAEIAQQVQALAPGYFQDGPVVDATGLKRRVRFQAGMDHACRGQQRQRRADPSSMPSRSSLG